MRRLIGILATFVVISLGFAACDSGVTTDPDAAPELAAEGASNTDNKVPVCHIGNKLPEYDATCTEGCGDAGKVDLIEVPASVAEKHLTNPDHSYGGVSDYYPEDEGASGEGNEDTDGDGIDEGCEIPQPEIPQCMLNAISAYNDFFDPDWDFNSFEPWIVGTQTADLLTLMGGGFDGARVTVLDVGDGLVSCRLRDPGGRQVSSNLLTDDFVETRDFLLSLTQ